MMMKRILTALLALTMLLMPLHACAEWIYEPPVPVTDEALCTALADYARAELARIFPGLTEAQRDRFTVDDVLLQPSGEGWSVGMSYDGCDSVMMEFFIHRGADGAFTTEWYLPWPLEELVALYDASVSFEDALAVGRISLGAAMAEEATLDPERARAAVARCGLAMLDPANFVVEAAFVAPMSIGSAEETAYWSLRFGLPVEPDAGSNWNVNPLWYQVEVDAATGAVRGETALMIFNITGMGE